MASSPDPGLIYARFFDCFRRTLITVMVEMLLYGAYGVIFILYVYLEIRRRDRAPLYRILLSLLFVLGTVALGLSIANLRPRALICFANASSSSTLIQNEPLVLSQHLRIAVQSVYVAANAIADTLLFNRCYNILESFKGANWTWWVIAGPALLCITNTGMAITAIVFQYSKVMPVSGAEAPLSLAGKILFEIFMGTNFFSNLLLTELMAGSIWWMTREIQKNLGPDDNKSGDQSMTAIILRSCLLYPIALVPCTVFELFESEGRFFLEPLLVSIVGLAPTLMVVTINLQQASFTAKEDMASGSRGSGSEEQLPVSGSHSSFQNVASSQAET
ncbi:hypothetical protein D9757_013897 [Collybiopsis confluens]|uniref:Uncharacterized protein n=1 Tax=Collybiopsis confluens TaxID=2823264 RepID=A0A8H5CNH4_9AGAR|nr:hypothetical protein D9757_013897 [Collybiopsis confluens]